MRMIAIGAAVVMLTTGGAYAGSVSSQGGAGENTCLPTNLITKTDVAPDERSITFHMKDGKTWVNTLQAACHGLNLHGFTYVSRTTMEVCSGQGIHLLQTGTTCELGQFAEGPTQVPAQQY